MLKGSEVVTIIMFFSLTILLPKTLVVRLWGRGGEGAMTKVTYAENILEETCFRLVLKPTPQTTENNTKLGMIYSV